MSAEQTLEQDYLNINQQAWDKRVAVHVKSRFYDVDGFIAGKTSLNDIELSALGDVQGLSLLHLQCHFGLDTLSWARLGAKVTGLDLSSQAITQAKAIAQQTQLTADFICSDVYASQSIAKANFDIVYTSYGVLCWLPDIQQWANTVAAHLVKGGCFYMAEFHPIHDVFDGYPYFHREQADIDTEGTYTENCDGSESTMVTWAHPISSVINALINAGISITEFNEFDYSPYRCFEGLIENPTQPQRFEYIYKQNKVPLIYSIKGVKT